MSAKRVPKGREFSRIASLPARHWSERDTRQAIDLLTAKYSKPGNDHKLFPVQAVALVEAFNERGLLGQLRVGSGKTLISLLAPQLLEARRPLLIVPASLRDKTLYEIKHIYSPRWHIAKNLQVISYDKLSSANSADYLIRMQPDLVICDEAHGFKDKKTARTRRFLRWARASREDCAFVFLTGSITRKSLTDYAHLADLALGDGSPVPRNWEADLWGKALGAEADEWFAPHPGVLVQFADRETRTNPKLSPIDRARIGYRDRLVSTSGVLISVAESTGIDLHIDAVEPERDPKILEAAERLRRSQETPDGDVIECKATLWAKLREIACGFYYVFDPKPPEEWVTARYEWRCFVRDILSQDQPGLDSPKQVALNYPELPELLRWRKVRDMYDPDRHRKPVWISDVAVDYASDWLRRTGGIVWTEHLAFGERMAQRGWTYYGGGDIAAKAILSARGPIVASIQAHGTGRNLQHYKGALVVSPPPSGSRTEQLLGRLVRHGQKSKDVRFQLFAHLPELIAGVDTAMTDARYIEATTGSPQLILGARSNDFKNLTSRV